MRYFLTLLHWSLIFRCAGGMNIGKLSKIPEIFKFWRFDQKIFFVVLIFVFRKNFFFSNKQKLKCWHFCFFFDVVIFTWLSRQWWKHVYGQYFKLWRSFKQHLNGFLIVNVKVVLTNWYILLFFVIHGHNFTETIQKCNSQSVCFWEFFENLILKKSGMWIPNNQQFSEFQDLIDSGKHFNCQVQ